MLRCLLGIKLDLPKLIESGQLDGLQTAAHDELLALLTDAAETDKPRLTVDALERFDL